MLRSAAKNHDSVTVAVEPSDYPLIMASMERNKGATSLMLRKMLAVKVFERTAEYDAAIASYLGKMLQLQLTQLVLQAAT